MIDWKDFEPKWHLNGRSYAGMEASRHFLSSRYSWEQAIGQFIYQWIQDKDFIEVQTSGSTGRPQIIKLQKNTMVESARMTAKYLGLKKNNRALLCLPATFIGGKMMLVRSLVLDLLLDIVKPQSNVSFKNQYQFCAMTPHQLTTTLAQSTEHELPVSKMIVGGGSISQSLYQHLQQRKSSFYSTYGMTETSSHIAMRTLNGNDKGDYYELIDDKISIDTDENDCLKIKAAYLGQHWIQSRDLVDILSPTRFIWKGRLDNVINSGGIKFYPEELEKKLAMNLKENFIIFGSPDPVLQECVSILIESPDSLDLHKIIAALRNSFSGYEMPRLIYQCKQLKETENGKIDRRSSLQDIQLIHKL